MFIHHQSFIGGEGNGTPFQYSCLENPMGGGAWWAAVHGVTKSLTRLSNFTFTCHFHPLEKEMATHSSVLAWRIRDRSLVGCRLWGLTESDMTKATQQQQQQQQQQSFPSSSVGKESACNAEEPSLILGSERSAGKWIGYPILSIEYHWKLPLQYSWASLMSQLVKNLSAMWETWV